jgi:hypothetical protein
MPLQEHQAQQLIARGSRQGTKQYTVCACCRLFADCRSTSQRCCAPSAHPTLTKCTRPSPHEVVQGNVLGGQPGLSKATPPRLIAQRITVVPAGKHAMKACGEKVGDQLRLSGNMRGAIHTWLLLLLLLLLSCGPLARATASCMQREKHNQQVNLQQCLSHVQQGSCYAQRNGWQCCTCSHSFFKRMHRPAAAPNANNMCLAAV